MRVKKEFTKLTKSFRALLSVILVTGIVAPTYAKEKLGELTVSDFLLEPTFTLEEDQASGEAFSLGRSYFGVGFKQDAVFSGHLSIGSKSLIVQPHYYGPIDNTYGVIEGYAQAVTGYGSFRFGLIPVRFGLEGSKSDGELEFPLSLVYQNRYLMRRDMGASYQITHNDFESYAAVHNGEGAADQDRRLWVTGRIAWHGPAKSQLGVSGMTGRWVDQTPGVIREQKVRTGNFFAGFNIYGLGLGVEGTISAVLEQGNLVRQVAGYHGDLHLPLGGELGFQLRYDFLDPDHGVMGDQQREVTAGLNWHSKYRTSSLYLYGVKRLEENIERVNDRIQLLWRLTPWFE